MRTLVALWAGMAAAASVAEAAPVGRIRVDGARTRSDVVLGLLDTKPGREFDPAVWEADLRRLRDLELFYDIRSSTRAVEGKVDVDLALRNKFSTLPIFKFKRGGGTSLVTAGYYDVNFLDRLFEAGGQFESFNGRPGFAVWFRHPYLLSRDNRVGTEVLRHTLDLPLFSTDGAEEASFENVETRWNARLQRELPRAKRWGLEASVYENRFLRDDGTPRKKALNDAFVRRAALDSGRTVSVTPSFGVGRIVRERHLVEGVEGSVQVELAHRAFGSGFGFAKGQAGALWGWRVSERWNIAGQARVGSKTGRGFQHKFYLGGLDTTRGFLDRQFRGEHVWMANLEARPTLVDRPSWVLQGAVYSDLGKTWDGRNFGAEGFHDPIFSYGGGVRLILPKVYRAVLRVDVARAQRPVKQMGFNMGLQQFF